MLGFEIGFWDYVTFLVLFLCVLALGATWLFWPACPGASRLRASIRKPKPSNTSATRGCCRPSTRGCRRSSGPSNHRHRRHPALPARRPWKRRRRSRACAARRTSAREAVKEASEQAAADARRSCGRG